MKFSIKTPNVSKGLRKYGETLEKTGNKVREPAVPVIQDIFIDIWNKGQADWKPLKPEYKRWKVEHGFSGRILEKTGTVFDALMTTTENTYKRIEEGTVLKYGLKDTFYKLYFIFTQKTRSVLKILFGPDGKEYINQIHRAMLVKIVK